MPPPAPNCPQPRFRARDLHALLRCIRSEAACVRIADRLDEAPGRLLYSCPTDGLHPGSCDSASVESPAILCSQPAASSVLRTAGRGHL